MPRDMQATARYPPIPRHKPFTFYTAVRNADPEMVGKRAESSCPRSVPLTADLHPAVHVDKLLVQLAKIMAADPFFVTQDNGAGAPLHFATTYRHLDMVRVWSSCF